MKMEPSDWKNTEINVDSLWIIPERDKSGKHSNIYHGNFVPQIPRQLIQRYTQEGEIVADIFLGSGTTLYECENLHRKCIGFDINQEIINHVLAQMASSQCDFVINNCDVSNNQLFHANMQASLQRLQANQGIDFFIAHPPYMDIIKFTDKKEDLSQIPDLNDFLCKCTQCIKNAYQFLKTGKYFAVVMGDVYKNSEVVPLGFYVMNAIKQALNVKMKGIIVKNIAGNRGKLGSQDIWKYRALHSDYYLFKHEYIFVFKKIR